MANVSDLREFLSRHKAPAELHQLVAELVRESNELDSLQHDVGVIIFAGFYADKRDAESLRTELGGDLYNEIKIQSGKAKAEAWHWQQIVSQISLADDIYKVRDLMIQAMTDQSKQARIAALRSRIEYGATYAGLSYGVDADGDVHPQLLKMDSPVVDEYLRLTQSEGQD